MYLESVTEDEGRTRLTHIKICGIQDAKHAISAAEEGADAVGLNFVPSSKREVTINQAKNLLAKLRATASGSYPVPEIVGLFADQPFEDVNAIAETLELDAVQLCGAEGMSYCNRISVPIYKTIPIDLTVPRSVILPKLMIGLQRHTLAGHKPILDTKIGESYGGTGTPFDWELAASLSPSFNFSVAGGLTPDNVSGAIKSIRPWGVDTSSGVENESGKEEGLIRAFIRTVRSTDSELRPGRLRALLRRGR